MLQKRSALSTGYKNETNSMTEGLLEANYFSATQKISHILLDPAGVYYTH